MEPLEDISDPPNVNLFHLTECPYPSNDSLAISEYGKETVFKYDEDKMVGFPYVPIKKGKIPDLKDKGKQKMTQITIRYKYSDKVIDSKEVKPCEIRVFNNGTYTITSAPIELLNDPSFEDQFIKRLITSLKSQGINYSPNVYTNVISTMGTSFDTLKDKDLKKNTT